MRTVKASILLGIGVMFIALAPLLRFYAMPHLEKKPLDFYYIDVAKGEGTYFDAATLRIAGPETLTVSRTERGDVNAGTSTLAVWDLFTNTTNAAGTTIDAYKDRWAFNRKSGLSTNELGAQPHVGLYLVWPFNAQKKTYPQYWDETAKRAFPARYIDTEKIQGHTVYRYTSVIPPVKIGTLQVPGSLVGFPNRPSITVDQYYSNPDSSVLIDPRTGAEVGGNSHQIRSLRLPGGTTDLLKVLDVNLTPTAATTKGLIKKAVDGKNKLDLVGIWLPIAALVLGIVLVVVAIWWDRRRPKVVALPEAGVQPPAAAAAGPRHSASDQQPTRPQGLPTQARSPDERSDRPS